MNNDFRDRLIRQEKSDKTFILQSSKEKYQKKVVSNDHSNKVKSTSHSNRVKNKKNRTRVIKKGRDFAKKKVINPPNNRQDEDAVVEQTTQTINRAGKNTIKSTKAVSKAAVHTTKQGKEFLKSNPSKKEITKTAGKGIKKGTFKSAKAVKDSVKSEVVNFKGDTSAQGIGEADQVKDSIQTTTQVVKGAKKAGKAGAKASFSVARKSQQVAQFAYYRAKQVLSKETAKVILSQLVTPLITIIIVISLATALISAFSFLGFGGGDCDTNTTSNVSSITSKDMETNAKEIYTYVKKEIPESTPQGLCGMIANFERESRLNPSAIERPNDPLSGHGLAQWTAGRTTNLKNFAQEKGKEWSDLGLQLAFLVHELKGAEKNAISALKMTDVHQATDAWQLLFERAGVPAMDERLAFADKWFAKLGKSDPISEGTISNGASGELESLGCGMDSDGGEILQVAKGWLGWFKYLQLHPSPDLGTDFKNPNKEGSTDCSGYVWLVLNKAGYKVPPNMGWYTMSMEIDAKGSHQYLKEVSESEATAGDIVIVNTGGGAGSNGHTGILAEKWIGNNTKVLQQGGSGDSVNNTAFGMSFTSLLSGGTVTFARPIKAGN